MFRTYYSAAKAAGVPVGAYWYSYADTPEAARIEANVCAQVLGDRKFEYPIAFDIEEPSVLSKPIEEISAIILAFCTEMEKKGYFVQIYCSSYYLNNRISKYLTTAFDVWVAHYNVEAPAYTGPYGIWQYGLDTRSGVCGDVDVDHCYRDYPALIKEKHTNGY
jgi:GH25 family lysozyme M1 (1,4-beta-N-acetylmuramidase)